jgi:hypothetical protein
MTEPAGKASKDRIRPTTSALTAANRWDHFAARWGVNRSGHRVEPGLYALGDPDAGSPVFVTANYTLSFDALRSALPDTDGYILVLDTKGINVWCAAGKGTFGTDELMHRVQVTALRDVVQHRTLILPQLGASGVAAHEVKRRSGFTVKYGPVRAADLPAYLQMGQATPEMRRVRFDLRDRLVLIPVELVHVVLPTLIAAVVAWFAGSLPASMAVLAAVLAGVVAFPILLPWIPTSAFSSKGLILGELVALPFALRTWIQHAGALWWLRLCWLLAYLLAMPPVTAYLALNFTGSSTYTSWTGVRREIFTYVPPMAALLGAGLVLTIALGVHRWIGGAR